MSVWTIKRVAIPPAAWPTEKQVCADAQETPASSSDRRGVLGLGTMDQRTPSQCSMSVFAKPLVPPIARDPTAVQSDSPRQVTARNSASAPGGSTAGTTDIVVPFHRSTNG